MSSLPARDEPVLAGQHDWVVVVGIELLGKGRKQRITPLTKTTTRMLRAWLTERDGLPHEPVFPTSQGRALSRDALEQRLTKHAAAAAERCSSMRAKKVTPHVPRQTAAMRLRHAGVDTTVIALWLGAMSRSRPPRSTCTPTSRSRNRRSPGPPGQRQAGSLPTPRLAAGLPGGTLNFTLCRGQRSGARAAVSPAGPSGHDQQPWLPLTRGKSWPRGPRRFLGVGVDSVGWRPTTGGRED